MTQSEIIQSFRNRDGGAKQQVKILAELNATTPAQITRILAEAGEAITDSRKYQSWTSFEVQEALRLRNEGVSTKEIAIKLGRAEGSVRNRLGCAKSKKVTEASTSTPSPTPAVVEVEHSTNYHRYQPPQERPTPPAFHVSMPDASSLCPQIITLTDKAVHRLLDGDYLDCAYCLGQLKQALQQFSEATVVCPPCQMEAPNEAT